LKSSSSHPKRSSQLLCDFSENIDRELDDNSVNVDSSTKALPVRDIPTTTMTTTTTGSWNLKNMPKFSRFLRGNVGSDWANPFVVSDDEDHEKVKKSYKEKKREIENDTKQTRTVPSHKYNHENKKKKKTEKRIIRG